MSPDGVARTCKVLSTTANYAEAIIAGIRELTAQAGIAARDIGEIIHGTTVATNAILERRGARAGLLTTRASATCSRSAGCASHGSTTSTSSARPRWCPAGGGARSASA